MKFKSMKIEDTMKRQNTLANESEKEQILYYEPLAWEAKTNSEFVVGLPLSVKEYDYLKLKELALQIREITVEAIPEPFVIAIHNKKLEDEVHFHVTYQNVDVDHDLVQSIYMKLN